MTYRWRQVSQNSSGNSALKKYTKKKKTENSYWRLVYTNKTSIHSANVYDDYFLTFSHRRGVIEHDDSALLFGFVSLEGKLSDDSHKAADFSCFSLNTKPQKVVGLQVKMPLNPGGYCLSPHTHSSVMSYSP